MVHLAISDAVRVLAAAMNDNDVLDGVIATAAYLYPGHRPQVIPSVGGDGTLLALPDATETRSRHISMARLGGDRPCDVRTGKRGAPSVPLDGHARAVADAGEPVPADRHRLPFHERDARHDEDVDPAVVPATILERTVAYVASFRSPGLSPMPADIRALAPAACRIHALSMACEALSPAHASLALAVAEAGVSGPLAVDDLVAVAACARMACPERVEEALRRHPLLLAAFARPRCSGTRTHATLSDIDAGAPPLEACRTLLFPGGEAVRCPAVTVRSLSTSGRALDGEAGRWLISAVALFHRRHPAHRALDAEEVGHIADALRGIDRDAAGAGTDIVAAMSAGGRVRPMPDGFADAFRSLTTAVVTLMGLTATRIGRSGRERLLLGTTFPDRRRHDGLARIDNEWHAGERRRTDAMHDLMTDVRRRLTPVDAPGGTAQALAASEAFPHVATSPLALGDVTATPLLSHADYVREGREMAHCVGTLGGRAFRAEVIGFSLSSADGTRSTLTLGVGDDGLSLAEHKGPSNVHAAASHAEAARWLLLSCRADAALTARLASVRRERAGWTRLADRLELEHLTEEEARRLARLLWAEVSLWLSPSEVAAGCPAWLARAGTEGSPPTA